MIAKLEWTDSNAQQNIEQLQNPTMGVTNNIAQALNEKKITKYAFHLYSYLYKSLFHGH